MQHDKEHGRIVVVDTSNANEEDLTKTSDDLKTEIQVNRNDKNANGNDTGIIKYARKTILSLKFTKSILNLLALFILGALSWGVAWCAWGSGWQWDGLWFRLAAIAALAWIAGYSFNSITSLPPLLAALLVGILARHFGYLDMRHYEEVDSFLRKIYPVAILGKASLGWDVSFMRINWRRVLTLGVIPWTVEVLVLAVCTSYMLNFPFIWGVLLGSIYASVSCAVVLPSVNKHAADDTSVSHRNWPQLVCTAGGIDTALSVGVYGLVFSYMFYDTNQSYRITKAALTLFVGVALGVSWGSLAKYVPHKDDFYVAEIRVLFVLLGGLFCNFFTSLVGWGGAGGVAVLACNMTAANHWKLQGWPLNKNPASTAYRVLWAALEPALFAYTGTYFVCNQDTLNTIILGFAILSICLFVRLLVTAIVCWDFDIKEKLFICSTWIPKSIVEAVLCPVALTALHSAGVHKSDEIDHAENIIRLIVQAIIITTPVGFLLTHYLGPRLLNKTKPNDNENGSLPPNRKSLDDRLFSQL